MDYEENLKEIFMYYSDQKDRTGRITWRRCFRKFKIFTDLYHLMF